MYKIVITYSTGESKELSFNDEIGVRYVNQLGGSFLELKNENLLAKTLEALEPEDKNLQTLAKVVIYVNNVLFHEYTNIINAYYKWTTIGDKPLEFFHIDIGSKNV